MTKTATEITFGPKCCNDSDLHAFALAALQAETDIGKPAWFDGTHLYTRAGKYLAATQAGSGEWKWHRQHDLSPSGIVKWFDPCEFLAYNAAMVEYHATWKAREDAIEQARKEREAKRRAAEEQDRQRRNAAKARIDAYTDANKIRGKKATFQIQARKARGNGFSAEPREGMVYGPFGVHSPAKGAYAVTHLASGMLIHSFGASTTARRFVFAIQSLSDWESAEPDRSKPVGVAVRTLQKYFDHQGALYEAEDLESAADAIGA